MKTKTFIFIKTLTFLLPLFFAEVVLAVEATLYGEVTDHGGDPLVVVWFEYGKTPALGFTTPQQEKYGSGEFSYTLTNLEPCTTYYYRAAAKHKYYNDTTYGEIHSFITPCETPSISVSLSASPSSGCAPLTVSLSASVSGGTGNITYYFDCTSDGGWERIITTSTPSYTASNLCRFENPGIYFAKVKVTRGTATSEATTQINVSSCVSPTPIPPVSIEKSLRNLSDGQQVFAKTIYADPNEVIMVQIKVTANREIQQVLVKDDLPERLYFRPNSLKVDGVPVQGEIRNGISLGKLLPNQTKTITFTVDVGSAQAFNYGETKLVNVASAHWDNNSVSATATIIVRKKEVLGVTTAPTGISLQGFVLPLSLSVVSFGYLLKTHALKWEEWLDEKLIAVQKLRANLLLKKAILKERLKKAIS